MSDLNERVLAGIRGWKPFRLLVVGDFMLDQALLGDAERMSPDAPVPVLAVRDPGATIDTPGGAGNVGVFAAALQGTVECVGVVGDDLEGRLLRAALERAGCATSGMLTDPTRPTTTKRSLVGRAQHRHPQKMFRIDVESKEPLDDGMQRRLIAHIGQKLDSCDVVCLEDYRKGVCTPELCREVIDLCAKRSIPVLIDPAPIPDYSRYRGATLITPNRSEAERATGSSVDAAHAVEGSKAMARQLIASLGLQAVVVTLDKDGAVLQSAGGDATHIPTRARQVYDVTGAGDMVLAVLAGAASNGFDWASAVVLANIAAGMEVEVFGVRPFSLREVHSQVLRETNPAGAKIRQREELLLEVDALRKAGKSVVLTNGCFDILHAGHVGYLREARQLGDVLIVAVNSDASVRALKGESRPVNSQNDRAEVLAALAAVDFVTVFDETTVAPLLRAIRPAIYAKGGDYTKEQVTEFGVVKELGIEMKILSHRAGMSSTEILQRVDSL